MRLLTVAEMRALEAAADRAGQSYRAMMEAAGKAVAEVALAHRPHVRRAFILVGPGNNGGDALVAARHLRSAGLEVAAWLSRARDDEVARQARAHGVILFEPQRGEAATLAASADLILDGLLGTGAHPPLRDTIAEMITAVGKALQPPSSVIHPLTHPPAPSSRPFIVAVDGPSGMDFDTGEIDPRALWADLTVTFAHPKSGHFRFPAAGWVGELVVAEIGIPPQVEPPVHTPYVADVEMVRQLIPPHPDDGHKGRFGRVLIVAGSANYTGAAVLATQGALRSGAGLVTLALPGSLHSAVLPLIPEATFIHLPHGLGVTTESAVPLLIEASRTAQAMVVGPGLTQEPEAVAFIAALFGLSGKRHATGFLTAGQAGGRKPSWPPLVLDADALNILARLEGGLAALPEGALLTPHPGEMARLTGLTIAAIEADRIATARNYARQWQSVLLLKGAFTVIAGPDGRVVLIPFANSGLAKGGSGDILAGLIGGLRAQGLSAYDAAIVGAWVHALAGAIARRREGVRGMTPLSVIRALPEAWQQLSLEDLV